MLKLAKGKGEREKDRKGAKAGTRFILFLTSAAACPSTARVGVCGEALALLPAPAACPQLYAHPRSLATAQMRHPDTLKRIMFLKCECATLDARGQTPKGTAVQQAPAAARCSGQSPRLR